MDRETVMQKMLAGEWLDGADVRQYVKNGEPAPEGYEWAYRIVRDEYRLTPKLTVGQQ